MKFTSILVSLTLIFTALVMITGMPGDDTTSTSENGIFISKVDDNAVSAQITEEVENYEEEIDDGESEEISIRDQVAISPSSSSTSSAKPAELDYHDPSILYELSPGVNLAAAEFAPDDPNYQHSYPIQSLDYYAQKRVQLVRLPFRWERMQPTLFGDLSASELTMMNEFLDKAENLGIYVILDLHNYARYNGEVVGTTNVPTNSLVDLWKKMIVEFKDHPAVISYGIMNEPHDTGNTWHTVAQEVVDGIREDDQETIINVCGDHWSGAYSWPSVNNNMALNDPSNKLVYEAHVYFDAWNVGAYDCTYDTCGVTDTLVSERIDPFIQWLNDNNAYGFIGEYGVPSDDQRWIDLMEDFYLRIDGENIGSTVWAGGPYWGSYVLSVEPTIVDETVTSEKPQMLLLDQYLMNCERLGGECIIRFNKDSIE